MSVCGLREVLVFSMGLITGTGTTITGKILYGIDSVGLDGQVRKMQKPIFQTWTMFFAMIFALPIQWLYHWHLERKWHKQKKLNDKDATKPSKIPLRTYFLLIIPAAFDLLASFLANVGLLYVTVSAFQLLKCTVIIFVAILKVLVLGDHLSGYMWTGIGLNTLAVLLVGFTSFADADQQNNDNPGFGITMIVLSCLVQSCQYVFEEKLMDDGENAPPLIVVGMEGVWGLILTSLIVYPIAYVIPGNDLGSNERFDDAWIMLMNSSTAQSIGIIYILAILGYNVFAVFVTYLLNSIWHAILDNFRPISVWGVDLLIFYVFTHGSFGEAWTNWSWLQFIGMFVLLFGTAVYNGTIRIPGLLYVKPKYSSPTSFTTPMGMMSSSLSRSPLISKNALKAELRVKKTPDPQDRDRVRREFLIEYQPEEENRKTNSLLQRSASEQHQYGSFDP